MEIVAYGCVFPESPGTQPNTKERIMASTQFFLAAGSRVVIVDKSGVAKWHTTTKEIIVEGELGIGSCPLTTARVRFIRIDGFQVFFPENILRSREILTDDDLNPEVVKNFRPMLFTYDLPDRAGFKNPSALLRRFAVRMNLSDWLLDTGDLPNALIGEMLDAGCNPRTYRFHPDDARKLLADAVVELRKQVAAAVKRAERSAREAAEWLATATAEEGLTADEAHARYERRAAGVESRLDVLRDDLAAAAARFGISEETIRLERLSTTGGILKAEMAARARAYLDAARTAEASGATDGAAVGAAIRGDKMDPLVAADWLDENGGDGAALRAAFNPEPATATADDDTFSLVGTDD